MVQEFATLSLDGWPKLKNVADYISGSRLSSTVFGVCGRRVSRIVKLLACFATRPTS
jgi:hypothetical protein